MICKINKWLRILLSYSSLFITTVISVSAQSNALNKYGLFVVDDVKVLQSEVAIDSNKQMVNLIKLIPSLILDLRYSTTNNFMHKKLYQPLHTTYLRLPAANALLKVMKELNSEGYTIKIFDAYRPYYVTEKMWEVVKDSRYAADPSKGSGHNRGAAVDVTLVNLKTKKELPMGTGFDNFSDTAHTNFTALPGDVLQNRILLKSVMEKFGFISLDTEWWHFSLANSNKKFELLNLSFKQLKRLNK